MATMAIGKIANFAAYTFAPAILVTPLGALSVIIGAVLAAIFLKEELGTLGQIGCAVCLMGSVIIVLHAPPDKEIDTVDEILKYTSRPPFLLYCLLIFSYSVFLVYRIVPKYGKKESHGVHFHLRFCRLDFSDVYQGVWYFFKVDFEW